MRLGIFDANDIRNILLALAQGNERAVNLAVTYGMSAEAARLYGDVYAGALADVGAAFGLSLAEPDQAALPSPVRVEGAWAHTKAERTMKVREVVR